MAVIGDETRYFGPASYRVENLAGGVDVDAELALGSDGSTTVSPTAAGTASWISLAATNVVQAVRSAATISRLNVRVVSKPGSRVLESRVYRTIPISASALWYPNPNSNSWLSDTVGQADITTYGYDPMGRAARVKDATGTVTRNVFDFRGLVAERWIGTSDDGWEIGNGRTTATGNSGDMTKVAVFEYDQGEGVSDGWLRKKTEDADGNWAATDDQRVTEYLRDFRGRVIVEKQTDAPTTVRMYDNLDRVIATATYANGTMAVESPADIEAVDPTTMQTGRQSLSETLYDARGQVYKTIVHRINQTTGAIVSGGELATNLFYDPAGRVIKTTGTSLTKTRYDRLGRVLRQWTLAKDGGGTYAENYSAGSTNVLATDIVLDLQQSIYDQVTGTLTHQIQVSRSPAEPTGGTLGTPGDLNTNNTESPASLSSSTIKGRAAITSFFYDEMDRPVATVFAGTGGLPDYNPSGSTPAESYTFLTTAPTASSAAALVSTTAYAPDGTVSLAADPAGKITKTEYDAAGRVVRTIRNFVFGGSAADQNQTVEYTYQRGLLKSMIAKMPTAQTNSGASGDQTTTYFYGTVKGTLGSATTGTSPASAYASQIATGHLLNRTQYPDGTNSSIASGTTSVHVAYNALGEAAWTRDQMGNVITTAYDKAGRITSTSAAVAVAFNPASPAVQLTATDDFVGSINLAYDSRGMVSTVTQKGSGTASNTVRDQVRYTYDDYGLLTQIRQKVDGAINTPPATPDGYVVNYTNSRAAPSGGRVGVRRTGMTLPGAGASSSIAYQYGAANELNDLIGRVEAVDLAGSTSNIEAAHYTYMGGAALAGSRLSEVGLSSRLYGSTSATTDDHVLSGLDRFGRRIESRWGRNAGTTQDPRAAYAFWVSIGYDTAGNITNTVDHLRRGHDVLYVNDGLDRLTVALEGTLNSARTALMNNSQTFKQNWTLSHTGNWLNFDETVGLGTTPTTVETRTHAAVNEIVSRTIGTAAKNFQYNAAGQLIDDSEKLHMYDAFGRLRYVRQIVPSFGLGTGGGDTPDPTAVVLLEESRYNGLSHRIRSHSDQDFDNDTDANDPWIDMVYDDSWRIVATFRSGDSPNRPRERFVYHCAGMDGRGSSSYIDDVILRERSDATPWTNATPPATLSDRLYYLQNWRHDVVATLRQSGAIVERTTYTSYGLPRTFTGGDFDRSGFVDNDDFALFQTPYLDAAEIDYAPAATRSAAGDYAEYDLNHDGVVDNADFAIFAQAFNTFVGAQPGELSHRDQDPAASVDNRIGYAGYQWTASQMYSVRFRTYSPISGQWTSRDPLGYVDGLSLFEAFHTAPHAHIDPLGLEATPCLKSEEGDQQNVPSGVGLSLSDKLTPSQVTEIKLSIDHTKSILEILQLLATGGKALGAKTLSKLLEILAEKGFDKILDGGDEASNRSNSILDALTKRNQYIFSNVETFECQCKKSFWIFGKETCSWKKIRETWVLCREGSLDPAGNPLFAGCSGDELLGKMRDCLENSLREGGLQSYVPRQKK